MPRIGSEAAAGTVAARGMVHQDLELAHPGRAVVEEAPRRGRCGTDADSHAAPRRDPCARRDLRAASGALRRNGVRRVRGKCDVLGAGSCLYVHRPCVKLLYRSYSKTSGDSDVLTSSFFPSDPLLVVLLRVSSNPGHFHPGELAGRPHALIRRLDFLGCLEASEEARSLKFGGYRGSPPAAPVPKGPEPH